jgi:hypothetical protein
VDVHDCHEIPPSPIYNGNYGPQILRVRSNLSARLRQEKPAQRGTG